MHASGDEFVPPKCTLRLCRVVFVIALTWCSAASRADAAERLPPVTPPAVTQTSALAPVRVAAAPQSDRPLLLAPIEQRLQAMEHKNAELEARFGSMLEENQHLARRLDQFTPASQQITPFQRETFDDQPEDIRTDQPEGGVPADSAISSFDQGFKWETRDGEYNLVFHNELQVDTRAYAQPNSYPVEQFGLFLSRGRVYFNGHMTKPVEYSISFNQGLADFQLLDVYLNFNYDPRFQVRIGRYRVPYMYEWYALSNQFLVSPERSVFALNYGYRRNEAIMLHGEVLDESMEYAVAVSTGPRNALFDTNSDKDMLAFVNYRPFQHAAATSLKNLNIGGSLGTGVQDNVPRPINFRTSLNASDSDGALQAAPIFLRFNDDVVERGLRRLWRFTSRTTTSTCPCCPAGRRASTLTRTRPTPHQSVCRPTATTCSAAISSPAKLSRAGPSSNRCGRLTCDPAKEKAPGQSNCRPATANLTWGNRPSMPASPIPICGPAACKRSTWA